MKFNLRAFVSLLLSITFTILVVSGIVLYITPRGRVANWTGWVFSGLSKDQWQAVHTNIAVLVLILAVWHLYFNWTIFWSYIKNKTGAGLNLKVEIATSIAVAAVFFFGAFSSIPPFSTIMVWNTQIKDYWERE